MVATAMIATGWRSTANEGGGAPAADASHSTIAAETGSANQSGCRRATSRKRAPMPSTRCQDTRQDATSRTARESSTPEENSLAGSNARLGTLQVVTAVLGLAAIAVYRASAAVADPDLWQQISLFREALELGSVPLRDYFAYTPTVVPSVHHEWLAGAIAYAIVQTFGGSGIAALRYVLLFGLGAVVWQVNRAQQVGFGEFAICALLGLVLMDGAFSTVRPQM